MGCFQVTTAATVSLKVATVEEAGSSCDVPISTLQCDGLGALQFVLTYDSTIVFPESVDAGSALSSGLVEFDVKEPGQLGVALVSSAPVDGAGELLKVRFKRIAPEGGQTDLAITSEAAWDHKNGLEMLVTAEPGSLTLKPDVPPTGMLPSLDGISETTMLIAGAAGVVVLLLIVIIALAMRKRPAPFPAAPPAPASPGGPAAEGGFCQQCGSRHDPGARFCPGCGQPIQR